jgi:tetratricopeptide (TPR) repeat protein
MRLPILALALLFPAAALAVDTDKPPEPTPTTTFCTGGKVWDHEEGACVDIRDGRLDAETLYLAAREFAHAGQYAHAIAALEATGDRRSDRVLTYLGFTHRKSGQPARGMGYYGVALSRNPDNLLARSYMGQGMVELGYLDGARAELAQIRARGGAGTWAERALLATIREAEAAGACAC